MLPKLTVSIITYNQERFIGELLTSVTSQECNFEWEILISDDASSDSTPSVLSDFASKFPDLISLRLRSRRVGMKTNLLENLARSKGEFIALCDGDDLWTNPSKLQRQVEMLEKNGELSMCFHYCDLVTKNGNHMTLLPVAEGRKPRSNAEDLIILESFMPTSSVVFRNNQYEVFPTWFWQLENQVDYPLFLYYASFGDIGFIPLNMATYRTSSTADAFTSQSAAAIFIEQSRMFSLLNQHSQHRDLYRFSLNQDRDLRRAGKLLLHPQRLSEFLVTMAKTMETTTLKIIPKVFAVGLFLFLYIALPTSRHKTAHRVLSDAIYRLTFPAKNGAY